MLRAILKSARPHQWVKNVFVVAPSVFAQRLADPHSDLRTAAAFVIFCFLSSAVYYANDLVDREKDRQHPTKCRRPIASGALSVPLARAIAIILAAGGLAGAFVLNPAFGLVALSYLALNVVYSLSLKRIAFIDVACLSLFYLLRVWGGAVAIPVPPSAWLLACTLLLSAMLGFGKRAHELRVAGEDSRKQREVLGSYDPAVLRVLLIALGVATTITYLAYTRSPHAREIFKTGRLVFTVPFVAFGVWRFIRIAESRTDADSPTDSMLRDVPFIATLVLYAVVAVGILYFAP
ncbi:MAG TPA: decaprenyl-phosphate phosphoribosyltransferase [Polyangia bacterium]|nr:decaprenyl-phosphate phosphoribosyltransferase [Polyangia bacterium]